MKFGRFNCSDFLYFTVLSPCCDKRNNGDEKYFKSGWLGNYFHFAEVVS